MRILLDTHCWLWTLTEPERISARVWSFLNDPGNTLYLSAASSWEIAIKWSLGKLPLPSPPEEFVLTRMAATGVSPLLVTHSQALLVAQLPLHHRDPFDRLLIAQAQSESLVLLTADHRLEPYGGEFLWADR